jgi:hypothetical protein
MDEPKLYRMIEKRLDGTLADWIAQRRAGLSWAAMATELTATTEIEVSRETLRRWFADRVSVEVKVA